MPGWNGSNLQTLNKGDCYRHRWFHFPLDGILIPEECIACWLYTKTRMDGEMRPNSLSLLFPALWRSDPMGLNFFSIRNVNYFFCLSRQAAEFTRPVGELTTCTYVLNVTSESKISNYSALLIPWADICWYCGKRTLVTCYHSIGLGLVS
jgi:hypothetical protein